MTKHKALHPSDDIDGQYVSRKEGKRGLASIEVNLDIILIQALENDIKKSKERLNYPIYQPLRSGRIWHKVNF